jgi:serine/threonine-protein kinase RIM15
MGGCRWVCTSSFLILPLSSLTVPSTDPDELIGTRISRFLAPQDAPVFQVATQTLREDDSHTVEVRFYLRVEPYDEREDPNSTLYQSMEGKGMMMTDREEGTPSHTMWVIKPCAPPEYLQPCIHVEDDGDTQAPSASAPLEYSPEDQAQETSTPLPFARPINVTPILCRICENSIPQWYFEKHNETCSETHRLEADIGECNESISELRNTIRDISNAMDRSSPVASPEYRGLPILSPSSSPASSSPLQLFRINKMHRIGVKKMQRRLIEQLDDTLQVALEISVPTLKEDEAKEPIERQRLLSPGSERKITQIRNWLKPTTSDNGLGQLVQDAERVMRQKIDTVIRLQNTIRYSEKVRQEWEERVAQALAANEDEEEDSEEDREEEEEETAGENAEDYGEHLQIEDDRSSTTSEYAFGGGHSSLDPTPLASTPSISAAATTEKAFSITSSSPQPQQPPTTFAWQGLSLQTRSSTPSSVSSPLALAVPIIASDSKGDCNPPHMDLNDSVTKTVRPRKSVQNLESSQQMSPLNSPLELAGSRRSHRRHSTINPVLTSITLPTSSAPVSPRLPSATPLSRTTPTSIKDFEVIKPISKGAFGSVFLAKKKATGDYYAIKVLKKADMIAKNQITNVKAERMILMKQAESPFVAKLFFTFQSKDNLYLVMEYLNGGDCAALIKSLGALPEEWTKNYVAEVVLGLEYLHQRGIIHRYADAAIPAFARLIWCDFSDLKPDNLLIDEHGHLKLTDFGLSRIGLLGRQTREAQLMPLERGSRATRTRYSPHSRPPSMDAAYLSSPLIPADLIGGGSYFNQQPAPVYHQRTNSFLSSADDVSESSGSDSFSTFFARRAGAQMNESPLQSFATELTTDLRSHSLPGSGTPGEQKFVGTPDYLAPETILGLRGDDATVDWVSLVLVR